MSMNELKHNKVTQEEAAKNLQVTVDGKKWQALRIAIVRRNKEREHWVHMVIVDAEGQNRQEYFVERKGMISAWLALEMGQKKVSQMTIEMNKSIWQADDVSRFHDADRNEWIQLDISQNGSKKIRIAIERQGMVDAFYALRINIEDIFESGLDMMEGLAKLM